MRSYNSKEVITRMRLKADVIYIFKGLYIKETVNSVHIYVD